MSSPNTGLSRSPKLLRGGLARIDPITRTLLDVLTFQYNPDTVTRTLQPRSIGGEPGDRLEVLRLTGPPHESIKFDAELDATDQLEHPDQNPLAAGHGLLPALACLERLITPAAAELIAVDALLDRGQLEIVPAEAPLTVLVWGAERVLPVTIASMSITEEAYDSRLRPLRAKVSLECKVLTTNDLPARHLGGGLYLAYRQGLERLAAQAGTADIQPLGLAKLP
ncbi:MAG: hypothetical protein ABI418_14350 [Jatrophihabitantaceae bacterium]